MEEIPPVTRRPFQELKTILRILRSMRRVAMVGLSANPMRPSYFVGYYLQRKGFEVFPVNPRYDEILGVKCYPDLASLPKAPEVVDVFRQPEDVPQIAEEALSAGAKALWLQFGVVNEDAARRAQEAGLLVVMDRCMKIEHGRYNGGLHWAGINSGVITSRRAPIL